MRKFIPVLALGAMATFLACRPVAPTPGPNEAIDPVCDYCRDLACIVVPITVATPRADYLGKTYYFCSENCRDAFLKDPPKYLQKTKA